MDRRRRAASNGRATAPSGQPATDGGSRSLWFDPPTDDQDRRPRLTRERVVTEALAVIAEDGVQALTMRSLAARLGVVPGAVYHHVANKQQLQDLLLDGVLAEVDLDLDSSMGWTEQLKVLAHRLRQLHRFFRSLPPDRFPALVALGEHVWVDNRDERFTAGLHVLVDGLEHARAARQPPVEGRPSRNNRGRKTSRGPVDE